MNDTPHVTHFTKKEIVNTPHITHTHTDMKFSGAMACCVQRRCYTQLQSHVENAKLSDKIVRGPIAQVFYKHPTFVMSREKMLNTIWVDIGVFKYSVNVLVPFFGVVYFLKA